MVQPALSDRPSNRWLRLVVIAFITYSLAYLDRINYGFGAAGGLAKSLNITSEEGGARGHDGAKNLCGRKRHLLVDTLGLLLLAALTAANVQDRDGARTLLSILATKVPALARDLG